MAHKKSSILHDEQAVRDAWSISHSNKEILERLNLRAAGGNYKVLSSILKKLQLEPSLSWRTQCKPNYRVSISNEDVFQENSKYSNRSAIKKRLVEVFGWDYICSECGNGDTWNDKPLTLQLDHINGVYNDHRIENLRFLCPNCHSQTSTFSGRSSKIKKELYLCDFCNLKTKKTKKSSKCSNCSINVNSKPKIVWPEEEELIVSIQEKGYNKLGLELGISANAIKKHLKCRGIYITIPKGPEGYKNLIIIRESSNSKTSVLETEDEGA